MHDLTPSLLVTPSLLDPIQELQIPYDAPPKDHKLDAGGSGSSAETAYVFGHQLPTARAINVFVFREFNRHERVGLSVRDQWQDRCAVQTKPFEASLLLNQFQNTIAHEIGHLLNMSVHDARANGGGGRRHDCGWFPERYYKKSGKLAPVEDWRNFDNFLPEFKRSYMLSSLMGFNDKILDPDPLNDWRWIRHEDWQVANEKARDFGELDH